MAPMLRLCKSCGNAAVKKIECEPVKKIANSERPPIPTGITTVRFLPKEAFQHLEIAFSQNLIFDELVLKLQREKQKPDIEVVIDGISFKCHGLPLRLYSDMFAEEFANKQSVNLPADKVSPFIFDVIHRWIYTKEVSIADEDAVAMYIAADYLRMGLLILNLKDWAGLAKRAGMKLNGIKMQKI